MREKFRAWDNILNKMVSVEHIVWKGGEIVQILAGGIFVIGAALKRFTLLQYTGINDSNKKEIYGDYIVKVTDDWGEMEALNTGIGIVEWLDDWGFWNVSNIEDGLGDLKNNLNIEIIGNKYENPELMPKEGE